jgi:PPE-repeat protein
MYGYAGSSATASALPPFTTPASTTNPSGLAAQTAALAHATGTSAGAHARTVASSLSGPLSSAAGGEAGGNSLGLFEDTLGLGIDGVADGGGLGLDLTGVGTDFLGADSLVETGGLAPVDGLGTVGLLPGAGLGRLAPLGGLGSAPAATIGHAVSVGALSVPQSWAGTPVAAMRAAVPVAAISPPSVAALPGTNLGAVPAIRPVAMELPAAGVGGAAAKVEAGSSGKLFGEGLLASMAGRAIGDVASLRRWEGAGAHAAPPRAGPVTVRQIAAELRELAELRDCGILTDEEFNQQKRHLLFSWRQD